MPVVERDDLKPCPFCGGSAALFDWAHNDAGWGGSSYYTAYVFCTKCGAKSRSFKLTDYLGPPDGTAEDAVRVWNYRWEG